MHIEKMEGRSDEILDFNGNKIYPDYLRHVVQNNLKSFKDFAVVKSKEQLLVKIEGSREEEVEQKIQVDLLSLLSSKGVNDIAIDFEYQFTRDLLTKRKRVFSI